MVISLSLLVAHILTTRRLLRYSRLAFLEIPHHKFQPATSRSTYLFISEPALRSVILGDDLLDGFFKSGSYVFASLVALH